MLNSGGPLLEHFARLAANVAGTSAATIGILGARKGLGPGRAAFGLSREQLAAFKEVEAVLASCPKLTIVPDLAEDHRFHQATSAHDHLGIRFLANMQLISPGGQQVGYICLLDKNARSDLTEAEIASLGHVASLVMADRRRAQRHLHLMHVADRALRVDEMLRLVSSAASCAEGLTKLLEALCHFHGAAVGQIWQLVNSDEPLVEVSHYHQDQQTGTAYQAMESLVDLNSTTADAIRRNRPHALKLSEFKTVEEFGDADARVFAKNVCVPIWVQQQRFGISLTFTTANSELDAVVADIASLGDTIRPALFQKVTEERLRFAAHHDYLTQLSNRLMFQDCLRGWRHRCWPPRGDRCLKRGGKAGKAGELGVLHVHLGGGEGGGRGVGDVAGLGGNGGRQHLGLAAEAGIAVGDRAAGDLLVGLVQLGPGLVDLAQEIGALLGGGDAINAHGSTSLNLQQCL